MKQFKTLLSFCVLNALLVVGAWNVGIQANTVTINGASLDKCSNGVFTGEILHGSVTLKGVGNNAYGFKYKRYDGCSALRTTGERFDDTRYFELSWESNKACTIQVTKVTLSAKMYNSLFWVDCVLDVNGTKTKIGTTSFDDSMFGYTSVSTTVAEGATSVPFSLSRNNDAEHPLIINAITLEYTVLPNAPIVTTQNASIDVTIDKANPVAIDLTNYFSISDRHFYESTVYQTTAEDGYVIESNQFYALKAGVYPFTAYVDQLKNCHEKSEVSANALTITVNRVNPTLTLVKQQDTLEATVDTENPTYYDLSSFVDTYVGDGLTYSVTSGNETAFIDGNKFYATATGEYTIRIVSEQNDRYNFAAQDVTIDVRKATPSIATIFEETPALSVGDTIENAFNAHNTLGMTFDLQTLNVNPINNGENVAIVYDEAQNRLVAVNAGQGVITFTQEGTDVIRPAVFTYTITVNKLQNSFSIVLDGDNTKEATLLWDQSIVASIKTQNTASDFVVTPGEGAGNYATFTKNANLDAHEIQAGTLNGSAKWYLSQAEDYKYAAALDSFMVTVQQEESACLIYDMYDLISQGSSEPLSVLGEVSIPGNGVAGTLTFNARRSMSALNSSMHVEEYVDNKWQKVGEDITDLGAGSKTYSRQLTPTATRFRFRSNGGLLDKYVKWITLSRNTYLEPAKDTIVIYDILRDATVADSIAINYSTCDALTIHTSSDNAQLNVEEFIATNENESKSVMLHMAYTATSGQAFGYDTINVRVHNASYDTSFVVVAEIVEKTRLQIAQEKAKYTLDSIANELKGENIDTIPTIVLDSLNTLLDSLKNEIENAEDKDKVNELLEEYKEELNNFMDGEKEKAKEEIQELIKDVDPILPELQELLNICNDSIDNANQLDSLQMRLDYALDSIQSMIDREREELRIAKDSATNLIEETVKDIFGDQKEELPEEWINRFNDLKNDIINNDVTPSKTIEEVNDTTTNGINELEQLREDIRQEVLDSIAKIFEELEPLSEEMSNLKDSITKKIEESGDLSEIIKEFTQGTEDIETQTETEKEKIVLGEAPYDNTELLESLIGEERDITIKTTYSAGEWTTICLPFDLQITASSPLENAQVVAMSNSTFADDTLYVNVRPVETIAAGQPYMIRVSEEVVNPVFESVTIKASEATYDEAGAVKFIGTLRPIVLSNNYDLTKSQSSILNYVADAEEEVPVNAFRAYFTVDDAIYADFVPVRVMLDKETVGIQNVKFNQTADKFIQGGAFFIRRGETIYNAQGQLVK